MRSSRSVAAFPRFRSKKAGHFTFRIPQRVRVEEGRVYVPKVGWVRIRQSRGVEGTTKSATFKRDATGHWYVALTTEFEILTSLEPPAPANPVGVDLGLKDLFVLSDGERVPAPQFARKADRKLRRAQKGPLSKEAGKPSQGESEAPRGSGASQSVQPEERLPPQTDDRPDAEVRFASAWRI